MGRYVIGSQDSVRAVSIHLFGGMADVTSPRRSDAHPSGHWPISFSKTCIASICRINYFTWFETNDDFFRISRSSIWHEKFSIASLSYLKIPRNILCKGISLISDSNRTDCPLVFSIDQPPDLLVFPGSMQIRENIGEHVCSYSCEYHCFASTQRFLVPQLRIDSVVPVRCDDKFNDAILFWY